MENANPVGVNDSCNAVEIVTTENSHIAPMTALAVAEGG